jgi:drug/metabolite transporter (DMT)-like permease
MQFSPLKAATEKASGPSEVPVHKDQVVLGMAASAASFFLLNTMNVFAKLLSVQHSVIEVAFYRNVIAAAPFAVWFLLLGHREGLKIHGRPSVLILRSVIGTVSIMATFKAFNTLPMADAQALFFTSSLFVPVMGYFFLREHVGPYRWSAVAIGFLGMLVVVRLEGAFNMVGASYAITAAFMHGMLGTLLRVLGRTERPETVTFYFLALGAAMTGLAMPFIATTPHWGELPLLLGAGISGALAQVTLSIAYKYAPVALVTIFNYTGIIWATAYGWLIWGDWPGEAVWTGAGIIIASSLFIVWRESYLARLKRLSGPTPAAGT